MKIIGLSKKVGFLVASLLVMSGVFGIVNIEQFFSLKKVEEKVSRTNFSQNWSSAENVEMMPCPGLNFTCTNVNLSLDTNCQAFVDPNQFLLITPQGLPRDTFLVTVMDSITGAIHSDTFGIADIGKVFKVNISVKGCNNAPCWSRLLIEDKIAPVLTLCASDTINCSEDYRDSISFVAMDNCGIKDTVITSTYTLIPCNNPSSRFYLGYYDVNIVVEDFGGRKDTCKQEIYVRRPNLDSIKVPAPATIECGSFLGKYPPEETTGFLLLNGNPLTSTSRELCMAELSKKDTILSPTTSCNKIMRRDWELILWTCGAPIVRKYTQIITIADTTAPTITKISDLTINLTTENCLYTGPLPKITATDCNQDKLQYEVFYPGGTAVGNGPNVSLGIGFHPIIYRVTDGTCGNVALDTFNLVILDKISPVALCASPIVAISTNGEGLLVAKDVNKGSYDYCGVIASIKIMRLEKTCNFDTIWQDTVTYCCTDVGRTDLMVALRVEDTSGNFNICMAPVVVQNKIVPDAEYPDDASVKCSLPIDLNNLRNTFGAPKFFGTECPNNATFDSSYVDLRDACGLGRIIRRFGLRYQGIVIERDSQIITIVADTLLQSGSIIWPAAMVNAQLGKTDTSFTGRPTWPILPCNVIGLSIKNDTIGTAVNGTCFKIERTFKIINWCGPNKNEVREGFSFTQIINVLDSVGPTITTSDTLRRICSFADNCNATELAILKATATDNGPLKDLNWVYIIDLGKDGLNLINGVGDSVAIQAPIGRHTVTFRVTDACGSTDEITYDFEVKNCKAPIAKCVNLVSVPMGGPTGMVEVCAKDFNVRSEDICSDTSLLIYTFNEAYPVIDSIGVIHFFKGNGLIATLAEYNAGTAQKWDPIRKTSCRIVRCSTSRTFLMTVWDTDRNPGSCSITLTLEGCCVDITPPIISTSDTLRRIRNTNPNCTGPMLVNLNAAGSDVGTPANRLTWKFELDRGNNGVDSTGTGNNFNVSLPVGTHKVKFTVEDTCANSAMVMYLIEIFNDKGPRAVCRDTLRITLGSGSNMAGMYILAARELDNLLTPSVDSCTMDSLQYTFGGTLPVLASINQVHYFTGNRVVSTEAAFLAGNAFRWNPTRRTAESKLGCGQLGTFVRTLTVWDPSGKSSSCNTVIVLSGVCPASLGDFVWEDLNANGRQDIGEPAIPNVRVRLLNANNNMVIDSQLTNNLGIYCFDSLTPGTYRVQFVTPSGFTPTTRNAIGADGTNNSDPFANTGITDVVNIIANQTNKDVDAGFYKAGAIGDFVWSDTNANGRQDAGEAGILNARVVLRNNNGIAIDSQLTNAQGIYCFENLVPGTYSVLFRTPSGFSPTTSNVGTVNDTLDSDPVNGIVSNIVIASGTRNKSVDAGFVPPANLCTNHPFTGFMVASCTAYSGTNAPVAVIYDTRPNANVIRNKNWVPTQIMGSNWTIDSIGQIFGIATDDSANVYLAHSEVYLIQNNHPSDIPAGRIYKARPPLFRAEVFTTLPVFSNPPNSQVNANSFNGIGNIVYDRKHNQLFATNLEDGKIYRISNTGVILDSYDPFVVDNNANGIAPQAEQIWGIGINYEGSQAKLYFPRIQLIGPNQTRQMFSLTLTPSGGFPNTANSEVLVINALPGDQQRITDIAFSSTGTRMLWAERGGINKYPREFPITEGSHFSISAQYNLTGGSWIFNKVFQIGTNVKTDFQGDTGIPTQVVDGENSAGGVDFGFSQKGGDVLGGIDERGWFSGNWLHKGNRWNPTIADDSLFYGAQSIVFDSIGNVKTDIVIDFDNNGTNIGDKGQIGDVEIFRCRFIQGTQLVSIAGNVATPQNESVEGVDINLLESRNDGSRTRQDGNFEISNLQSGGIYTIAPHKDDDVTNGVNVIDLLHLQRHILGTTKLNTAYKHIAGDVNNDQNINISDIIALRKVILGVEDKFVNNTSWKFIDKSQVLDQKNPWSEMMKESIEFNGIDQSSISNFIGVKIGDLDANVIANTTQLQNRSNSSKHLMVEKTSGEGWIKVPVYGDFDLHAAMELSFRLKGFELKDIESGQLTILNENISKNDNTFKLISWSHAQQSIDTDKPLFYLVIKGSTTFEGKNLEIMNSSFIYSDNGLLSNLEVADRNRSSESTTDQVVLHQNYPNPWENITKVVFELPNAGKVNFRVFDLTGKQIISRSLEGEKGINEINVIALDLPAEGMYTYSLQIGQTILNKRFIFIGR